MSGTRLLTPDDMAELLGVPRSKVMEWRRRYDWPCVQMGRRFRFTPEQVDQILARHTTAPVRCPDPEALAGLLAPRSSVALRRSA